MRTFHYDSIFTLGPAGTFSDEAAQRIRHDQTEILYFRTFSETLSRLKDSGNTAAVVPVENSVAGVVAQVQELIVTENLKIMAEINIRVQYALLANVSLNEIETYFAHPQAAEQTNHFAQDHFPNAKIQFSQSNVDSGVQFLKAVKQRQAVAAVVPLTFAQKYPDYYHSSDIQDYKSNTTRFFVVQQKQPSETFDFNLEKTSLFIEFTEDRVGLLYDLLTIFNHFNVNLCRLESRPDKVRPWFYDFYVDFRNTGQTAQCIEALHESSFQCKVLGSYSLVS